MVATFTQRCMWLQSQSRELREQWDRDMNGFTEKDFPLKYQDVRGYLWLHLSAPLHRSLTARHSVQASKCSKSPMNSDVTFQTEVTLHEIRYASDLGAHMWVKRSALMWLLCAADSVMKKQIWVTYEQKKKRERKQSERSLRRQNQWSSKVGYFCLKIEWNKQFSRNVVSWQNVIIINYLYIIMV